MIPLMMDKDYKPQGWRESLAQSVACDTAVRPDRSGTNAHAATRSGSDAGHEDVVSILGSREGW